MAYSILFVDDDANLLKSFRRMLTGSFQVVTANSPEEGLTMLVEKGPFPVIVSDMKMPGMSGIELLGRARKTSPDTVRILLTGYADQQTAIDAVNKGAVYRFLTKPCDIETLTGVLKDAIRQYQLVVSERELLEQTLLGTVRVLSQIVTLINPSAQGLAGRLKRYCRHMCRQLSVDDQWVVEIAAMLSQLGCLTIPAEILAKQSSGAELNDKERDMVEKHPAVAVKLLTHIPRLEKVLEIIAMQDRPYVEFPPYNPENRSIVDLGAQMLNVAIGLDRMLHAGVVPDRALAGLRKQEEMYNPALVDALDSFEFGLQNMVHMSVGAKDLSTRMILDQDVLTAKGLLLASKGQQVTKPLMIGIGNYAHTVGVNEPIAVLVPLLEFDIEE